MQRVTRRTERLVFLTVLVVLAAVIGAVAVTAASLDRSPSDNRKDAVEARNAAFNRAKALYPDPVTSNFPMRKQLIEFTTREDKINHPWYVYILGDNGNVIGYYVAKFAPENSCNFISSTQDIYHGGGDSDLVMQSPSYDGVYYGSSTCDEWFFFDAATNALIKIRGMRFYTADQPLRLDAKPIRVQR